MANYTFAQLEGLWEQAGGSSATAPVAAAIALAESGGNPDAAYPGETIAPGTGTTTDATGLWQILGLPAGNFTAAELTNPQDNAEMAVAKYTQAGNSFSPWQTYTNGAYKAFLPSGTVAPVTSPNATIPLIPSNIGTPATIPLIPSNIGTPATAPPANTATGGNSNPNVPSAPSVLNIVEGFTGDLSTIIYDIAKVLNFGFNFTKPGQWERIVTGTAFAICLYFVFRLWLPGMPSASGVARDTATAGAALV